MFDYSPEPPVEPPESGIYCEMCGMEVPSYKQLWNLPNPRTGKGRAVCLQCIRDDIIENWLNEYEIETTAGLFGYEQCSGGGYGG